MPALSTIVDPFGLGRRAAGGAARAARSAADSGADAAIELLGRALVSPRGDEALDVVVRSGFAERVAGKLLDSGAVDRALDSPRTAEIVARVLDSQQLWVVVEEIAQSPAVTQAITQQSAGFAGQVADEVGQRSRRADAWLERRARRVLHRPPTPQDAGRAEPEMP